MSLTTPEKIRNLQKKLYLKARQEPNFRFYQLWDKVWRSDILDHAYRVAKANGGAAGVNGVTFEQIESRGLPGVVAKPATRLAFEDLPATAGAAGDDPQAWRRPAFARYSDHSGPGGADRYEAGDRTDLRSGVGPGGLWLPTETGARAMRSEECMNCCVKANRCSRRRFVEVL